MDSHGDLTGFGDGRGDAYVNSEPHPTEWRLFEIATFEGLIPVFPFRYHDHGTMTVRIVGPTAQLQAAGEASPDGVETAIEQVGESDLGQASIPPPLPPHLSRGQPSRARTRSASRSNASSAAATSSVRLRKPWARAG